MMGWWFPGRTLAVVLPLMPLVLTILLTQVTPALRAVVGTLGVWSVATTAALARAAGSGEVTLAVDPFALRSFVFNATSPLFPDYRAWSSETVLLTIIWLLLLAATTVACARMAGLTLPRSPLLAVPNLRTALSDKAVD
jgi:hypothetical protein